MLPNLRRTSGIFIVSLAACGGGIAGDGADSGPVNPMCTDTDSDGDGICDEDEIDLGTDPNNPDTDGDGINDGDEIGLGTDPLNPDTDGDGVSDGDELVLGTDPTTPDEACAQDEAQAVAIKKPVDIIFVVDNSGSMTKEIQGIETNINTQFASIIAASGIDYQVIMIASHGEAANQDICISMPLSGSSCTPVPNQPTLTAIYKHYDRSIGSNNSLSRVINGYAASDGAQGTNGWSEWLRAESFKVFIEFTDDNQNGKTAAEFDTELLALSPMHFGTAAERNYVFHSIIGVKDKDATDASIPYDPTDPVVSNANKCGGDGDAVNSGITYQDLSILTQGLRFSLCAVDNYSVIFSKVAEGVVDLVGVPCSYALPEPTNGQISDPDKVVVTYTPGGVGDATSLTRVADAAACGADSWYTDTDGSIALCPDTCAVVEADEAAAVKVLTGCSGPGVD